MKEIQTPEVIEELYKIYKTDNLALQEACFLSRYNSVNREEFLNLIKQYIVNNSCKLSNFFTSFHNQKNEQAELRKIIYAFDTLSVGVNEVMDELQEEEFYRENNRKYDFETDENIYKDRLFICNAVDLFSINSELIETAYKKHATDVLTEKGFEQVMKIISKVKSDKALDKVFGGNLKDYTFDQVVYMLFDHYKKDRELFDVELIDDSYLYCDGAAFTIVSSGEESKIDLDFDRYRSSLIAKKACGVDLDKLAFCINLMEYYKTGVMVDNYGVVDLTCGDIEKDEFMTTFKRTYSRRFDDHKFRENQTNFVLDESLIPTMVTDVEIAKSTRIENSLIIGILLRYDMSSNCVNIPIYSLLHINIDDITKPNCKYEIQYNLFPYSKFENRLQIFRLDNFETEVEHKNRGLKLKTATHLHKYNRLDILSGRNMGRYEISHNIEGIGTNIIDSLKYFLSLIHIEEVEVEEKIIKKVDTLIKKQQAKNLSNAEIKTNCQENNTIKQ